MLYLSLCAEICGGVRWGPPLCAIRERGIIMITSGSASRRPLRVTVRGEAGIWLSPHSSASARCCPSGETRCSETLKHGLRNFPPWPLSWT